MINIRQTFTEWYFRKGYRMTWATCDYGDGVSKMIFECPWWVRPMINTFFSPCAYYRASGYQT